MKSANFKIFTMLFTTIIALTLQGCDFHAKEREELKQSIKSKNDSIAVYRTKIEEQKGNKIKLIVANEAIDLAKSKAEKEIKELKSKLSDYLLDHKMATVAILAGSGSAAALVLKEDFTEDERAFLKGTAIISAVWALFNSREVAEVSKTITINGAEIAAYKVAINKGEEITNSNKQTIQSIDSEISATESRINSVKTEASKLESQLHELPRFF